MFPDQNFCDFEPYPNKTFSIFCNLTIYEEPLVT